MIRPWALKLRVPRSFIPAPPVGVHVHAYLESSGRKRKDFIKKVTLEVMLGGA